MNKTVILKGGIFIIYVTGDTHGSIDINKLNTKNFPQQKEMNKNDYVIICGDFGCVWNNSKEEFYWRNWLKEKNFTTLWIDGNHECISKDTEILTENGWLNIEKAYNSNLKIANFSIDKQEIVLNYPLSKHKSFKDKAVLISGKNTKQTVSLNHDLIINNNKIKAFSVLNKKIQEKSFILHGKADLKGLDISDDYIKLLTWVITDGTIIDYSKYNKNSQKCTIQFKLSLQHKIDNLQSLLNKMKIPYTLKKATKSKTNKIQPYLIRIYSDYARTINKMLKGCKTIPKEWRNFNKKQINTFLNTLIQTDGTHQDYGNNAIIWRSTEKDNVDYIMESCIKNNIFFTYNLYEDMSGFKNGNQQYICRIYRMNKELNNYVNIKEINYNDYMYCFTMPLGTLITRQNGKVAFTGNCFDLLDKFHVSKWNGGNVHFINDSVIHLMRGQIYTIDGLKFFTMGGATSIDKHYRVEGKSWWKQEIPNKKEFDEALDNLSKHNWKVDYVITHTTSKNIMESMCYIKENNPINTFFDMLEKDLDYRHWCFGHFHDDIKINPKHTLVYEKIIQLF